MNVRSLLASVSVFVFVIGSASTVFADTMDDVQKNITATESVLRQEQADLTDDQAEATLEAGPDLFPDDGHGQGSRAAEEVVSPFVTFRINGVPYALKDVPVAQWFAPYVRDMADRGIVSGYRDGNGIPTGVFGPERSVTVEELSKMAVEAAHIDHATCPAVPKNPQALGSWSSVFVSCAESHNFVLYSDGTTDLHRPATRAEVVMTVLQAFGVTLQDGGESPFSDVSLSTLFAPAILTAVRDGIVAGYADANGHATGIFGPATPVNRAEVCKILSRALQVYGG